MDISTLKYGLAFLAAVIIRAIFLFLKALAINNGEIDDPEKADDKEVKWKGKGIKKAFIYSFLSNSRDTRIDDYWLPFFIGLSELCAYPFLMYNGYWKAIAVWLLLKTAISWGGWQKTRTAYNRFLFGNILSLGCSHLLKLLWF